MKEGKNLKKAAIIDEEVTGTNLQSDKFVKVYSKKPIHDNKKR